MIERYGYLITNVYVFQNKQSIFGLQIMVVVILEEVVQCVLDMRGMEGLVFLEIKILMGSRKNLGRFIRILVENKEDFMYFLVIN